MTKPERHKRVWFHGSPHELTELAAGSTITPNRNLARAFSHKPTLVCVDDDGAIRHNGTRAGILYRIDEPLTPGDIHPHPRSSMPDRMEWLTNRPLRLRRLGRTCTRRLERLTEKEVAGWIIGLGSRSTLAKGGEANEEEPH